MSQPFKMWVMALVNALFWSYMFGDLLDYMPDSMREVMCEDRIIEIKNQTLGSILEDEK